MKRRIYTDISVLAGCGDEQFREDSRRLLERFTRGEFVMVISLPTVRELESLPAAIRNIIDGIPTESVEKIDITDEAKRLSVAYLENDEEREHSINGWATGEKTQKLGGWAMGEKRIGDARAFHPAIIKLTDLLLTMGIHEHASEIVIDGLPEKYDVQFCIEGVMTRVPTPPLQWFEAVIDRIKFLAGLTKNDDDRVGRLLFNFQKYQYEMIVESIPADGGEILKIKILSDSKFTGISRDFLNFNNIREALHMAMASVARVSVLATWRHEYSYGCEDFLNECNTTNQRLGYPRLQICTPTELLKQ